MQDARPDEIYNFAAPSHVHVSFEALDLPMQIVSVPCDFLEAIGILMMEKRQPSTSELYGTVQEIPQREIAPFYPRWPYATAKLYGHWITVAADAAERSRVFTAAD